ncbi:unnamed protein product [Pedinophyceae sp. YPF-701]|nr:unnamed protein product [Pedinophyceae sp. YPF-701]
MRPAMRRDSTVVAASAADLEEEFGIEGSVKIVEGKGGIPKVVLTHVCGSSAEVYLHGACVTSWRQANGSEVLYVRPDAVFDRTKPIAGGIPLCFPQFGPGAIQQHGFARNVDWEIASTSADLQPDEKDPEVEFVLTESDFTLGMWPHPFKACYTVTLHGEILRTDFRVINTGDGPFEFTAALHSYLEVLGIDRAAVTGLDGLTYLDKTKDPASPETKTETRARVTFEGPTDSVYLDAGDHQELDVGTGAAIAIDSDGWGDVVVWNPWTAMEACYQEFCCVEKAQFSKPVTLQGGESWRARMDLQVVDLPVE